MTEIIPATATIVAEDLDQSQGLNQPRIVSRELNFDFGQFFYPQERRRIFETRYLQAETTDERGNRQGISAIVNPHARLGTLTTLDERVFYALIEIWQEQSKPNVCLFSEREIARRIRVQWGGDTAKAIHDSLTRLAGVQIEWQGSFYDSVKGGLTEIRNPFCILNHLEFVSTKTQHVRTQRAEFGFNQRVVKNLNSNHSRPVRFDVILSFRYPLAQALYTFSEPKLYGTKEYHRRTKKLVGDLGLIAKSWQRRAIRVQEFTKLQKELIGKPTCFGEIIESYEIVSGKDDAVLVITRSGAGRIKGRKVEVLETPQAKRLKSSQKPHKPCQEAEKVQHKETPTPVSEKPAQGDSGFQELSTVFEDLTSSADISGEVNAQALELLRYFDSVFGLSSDLNQNDVPKAELFVERYSLSAGKFLVDFAHRQGSEPTRFSDILSYRAEALEAFKHQRQESKNSEGKVVSLNVNPDQPDLKAINYFHSRFGGRIQASEKVRSKVQSLIKAHSLDFAVFLVDFAHKKISETDSSYKPNSFSGILSSQNEALEEWERGKRRKKREEIQAQKLEEMRLEAKENEIYRAHRQEYFASIDGIYERVKCVCPERIKEFEDYWISKKENQGESASRFYQPRRAQALVEFFKADIDIDFPEFSEWYSNSLRSN